MPPTRTLPEIVTALSTEFINLPAEEIDGAIADALGHLGEFAGVDRAYVFLIDLRTARMANTHEWCRDGIVPQIANLQDVPVEAYAWCMSRILERELVHIPRVSDLPDDQPDKVLLASEEIQSLLAVPITSRSTVIGLVGFDAVRHEQDWNPDTVALLRIVGAIFGNALDRKQTDQALQKEKAFAANVIETAGSLVLVLAPDGRCLRANRAMIELTGLSAEELGDTGWQRIVATEYREAARAALRSAGPGVPVQFEGMILGQGGEPRTILWNGAVARSAGGRPEYVIVTGIDLTETRILREQVEQSRRLDSLGRVAATIAHEFNNVLMAINPNAQVIARHSDLPGDVRRAAERISSAVKRGERITQEVTRFARPAEPAAQEVAVAAWTEALVDEMRTVVAERAPSAIEVEMLPFPSTASVVGDPLQLHQVFCNLILNAADAIPAGGRITVAVEEVETHDRLPVTGGAPEAWVHWSVNDTGGGIAPAVLDHIFEPLFTTKQRGTGLGLAVANQIVKAHGGHLSVETSLGQGTTFHVFLHRSGLSR